MNSTQRAVADGEEATAKASGATESLPAFTPQAPGATELRLAPDRRWWAGVAALIRTIAPASAFAANDYRRVVVIVPRLAHTPMLHRALHAVLGGTSCIAPRVHTLQTFTNVVPGEDASQRAELLEALRQSPWVRERFGAQAAALWSLAADIAALGDELTLAACGDIEAFQGRWLEAVQKNFSERAAAAGKAQAQLVLTLWRAGLSQDLGATKLREGLERSARRAQGPLIWLAPQGAAPWQRAYCRAYAAASGQRACLVSGDFSALVQDFPWLGAAWPELDTLPNPMPPIAARARALAQVKGSVRWPQLQIHKCNTLEEESSTAAAWVVDRIRDGCQSIALVALDWLTARRVRALLDHAQVRVCDEAGWKLSTTSAAAALMRWIDVVLSDFQVAELLDWLRSPFTLAGQQNKEPIVAFIASVLFERGVVGGMSAVRAALGDQGTASAVAAARALMEELFREARQWQRPRTLGRFLGLTLSSLTELGMRSALEADAVGCNVLEAIEVLHEQLAGSDLRLELSEFRAFLAGHFEQLTTRDREIDSPVVMTTLSGTRIRHFDAALLIGADADHLPARRASAGLLAPSIRRELGLRTEADDTREQTQDLAALLATTSHVAATWRAHHQDEPLPLSPLLDRLSMLAALAGHALAAPQLPQLWHSVPAQISAPRSPCAPELLPRRISASSYQDLVDCPYRFFGLRMLGLREAPRLAAKPEKRDFGLLLHAVLYEFHAGQAPGNSATDGPLPAAASDAALESLRQIVDARTAPLLAQRPALIGYRQRLRLLFPGYLQWLRQAQHEGWHWQDGELVLTRPLVIDDRQAVALEGRIDRLDRNYQGQLRVLDYKSRDVASLRKGQRDFGEDVQLLFYGLLLDPPAQEAAYLSIQRPPDPRNPSAKVATLVHAPVPFAENVQALQTRLRFDLSRIAQGVGLAANGAESICRRCELRSLCRHGFTAQQNGVERTGAVHE